MHSNLYVIIFIKLILLGYLPLEGRSSISVTTEHHVVEPSDLEKCICLGSSPCNRKYNRLLAVFMLNDCRAKLAIVMVHFMYNNRF